MCTHTPTSKTNTHTNRNSANHPNFGGREFPELEDSDPLSGLRHDFEGTVSVWWGNDRGFGFTILPSSSSSSTDSSFLDKDNIVVGRVLEGIDVIQRINETPVVRTSASVNYMSLTGASPQGRTMFELHFKKSKRTWFSICFVFEIILF